MSPCCMHPGQTACVTRRLSALDGLYEIDEEAGVFYSYTADPHQQVIRLYHQLAGAGRTASWMPLIFPGSIMRICGRLAHSSNGRASWRWNS